MFVAGDNFHLIRSHGVTTKAPNAGFQYVQERRGGLGWRASDQLVLAAMFAGALLCVSFLPSNVGVTDTSPMRNSTAIDFGSYRSFNDLRSLKAIPACKFRKYKLGTAY